MAILQRPLGGVCQPAPLLAVDDRQSQGRTPPALSQREGRGG